MTSYIRKMVFLLGLSAHFMGLLSLWIRKEEENVKKETQKKEIKNAEKTTPLGIEPRISGSVDQRLIHWAMESLLVPSFVIIYIM